MKVYLIDGTYELFRAYYGAPSSKAKDGPLAGTEIGAVRGFLRGLGAFVRKESVTHVACAFDQVIESFRNQLFAGYKTGDGVPPDLLAQFPLAEEAARALGICTWPMVEFEADDALASAAAQLAAHPEVEQVLICSPDKDLCQCVSGSKIVTWDRLREKVYGATEVQEKFGVPPASIPDWLALVGDTADGIPGIPKWGEKSAATVLGTYPHLEDIPDDPDLWSVSVRGKNTLAENLRTLRTEANLYRTLATLRTDVPILATPEALRYERVPRKELTEFALRLGEGRWLSGWTT